MRQRYVVRGRDGGHGVWDTYLAQWEANALDMDVMSEYDAEVLAADLNTDPASRGDEPARSREEQERQGAASPYNPVPAAP